MKNALQLFRPLILSFFLLDTSALASPKAGVRDFSLVSREWGVDQGLTTARPYALAQTNDGVLWVGTQGGLHRYNGRGFDFFDPTKFADVTRTPLVHLSADTDGGLWCKLLGGKIFHYQNGEFQEVHSGTLNTENWFPHPSGGLLACMKSARGPNLVRITTDGATTLGKLDVAEAWRIAVSPDGRIWISERDGKLHEWVEGKLTSQKGIEAGGFTTLKDGSLIATGRSRAYRWKEDTWQVFRTYSETLTARTPPGECAVTPDGNLWLSAAASERWVCETDGTIRELSRSSRDLPAGITNFLVDQSGDLWVSTLSGLFQLRYRPFVHWEIPSSFPSNQVVSIAPLPDGGTWFNTIGSLGRILPGEVEAEMILKTPKTTPTWLASGPDGSVWLADTRGRFSRIPPGQDSPVPITWNEGTVNLSRLTVAPDNVAWHSSLKGVFRADPAKLPIQFEKVSGSGGLPEGNYQFIGASSSGTLFAVHRQSGIHLSKDRGQTWTLWSEEHSSSILPGGFYTMADDQFIWGFQPKIGVLGCWGEDFHATTTLRSVGMGDVIVRAMVADGQGTLWLTTASSGVIKLNCAELLEHLREPSKKVEAERFGIADGLPSLACSYMQQIPNPDSKGRIWIPSKKGISMIDPGAWMKRRKNHTPPPLKIVSLASNVDSSHEVARSDQPLELPPGTRDIAFELSSLPFAFPDEIQYRYRLIGYDEKWSAPATAAAIEFRKLPPGDYRLEAAASDRFSSWTDPPDSFSFSISPYWWQRRSIHVLAGVLVLSLVYWLIKRRINRIRQESNARQEFSRQLIDSQEKERRRIASELHDGLGQSLLVLKNLAIIQAQTRPDQESEGYQEIAESAGKAIEEVRGISRALRPPELDRLGLPNALRATARRIGEVSDLEVNVLIDQDIPNLAPTQEIAFFRIFQEALNNALKHAKAGNVIVRLQANLQTTKLTIEDDGIGIPASVKQGVGLSSMKERASLIGGTLTVENASGKGTCVSLSCPRKTLISE